MAQRGMIDGYDPVMNKMFTIPTAQSFKVWNVSLPFTTDDFGVGVFDNTLTVINGEARQKSNNNRVNLTSRYSLSLSPLCHQYA
eukprot:UN09221